ncbi:type IV toxin-antitoxin system AbiEi family antitoxin domain-containing protein [Streptomyces sp. NPDC015408]|uniref:type IV toxin-antitoxin system AbiEi family antitoxin domain-containing protein n=1 Tax=Streptomyces sp. NPDC015408 TaxID=3364956 RepID=UPI0036F7074A
MDRAEQLALVMGVAADQWGLVTAAQAKTLGVSGVQLMRLTEAGLLESVGRGVYALPAVGMPQHLEVKVAWLRLQPGVPAWERPLGGRDSGVVSHASACQLHDLGDIPAPEAEISVPRRRTTTEPFVRLRTAPVDAADITVVDGLPVTTPARTIVDLLHAKADGGHIGGVIVDAERRDLLDLDALAEAVQPYARKYGLSAAATGHDLIEHLADQAGRSLHSQEVARAGEDALALGAQLGLLNGSAILARYLNAHPRETGGILARYLNAQAHPTDAVKPFGQAAAAQAFEPLLSGITKQQFGSWGVLDDAMPRLFPQFKLDAFQMKTPSPFAGVLKDAFVTPGLKEALRQATLPGSVLSALTQPSVLSPEARRALHGAAVPKSTVNHAARALQQLAPEADDTAQEPEEASLPDGDDPKELKHSPPPG